MTVTSGLSAPRAASVIAAVGCALLVMRPLLVELTVVPTVVLVALFCGLLAAGSLWPDAAGRGIGRTPVVAVVGAGCAAFLVGRIVGGGGAPHAAVARLIVLDVFAAIAEEAFFRRLVYRLLEPGGAALAVVGSAALFALVHVTVYGAWVLPIDLAAGLVFAWQRWASGSWRAPAITHVVANVVAVL